MTEQGKEVVPGMEVTYVRHLKPRETFMVCREPDGELKIVFFRVPHVDRKQRQRA